MLFGIKWLRQVQHDCFSWMVFMIIIMWFKDWSVCFSWREVEIVMFLFETMVKAMAIIKPMSISEVMIEIVFRSVVIKVILVEIVLECVPQRPVALLRLFIHKVHSEEKGAFRVHSCIS